MRSPDLNASQQRLVGGIPSVTHILLCVVWGNEQVHSDYTGFKIQLYLCCWVCVFLVPLFYGKKHTLGSSRIFLGQFLPEDS